MTYLNLLAELFPRTADTKHSAFCERIPIQTFNAIEHLARQEMRRYGYRAIYRGPRKSNHNSYGHPTMTRRQDATHVLLYRCG